MKTRICHITSVHNRRDVRIFYKECTFLAQQGYEVHLIVADGKGNEVYNDVRIHDVGLIKNRLLRILKSAYRAYRKALEIDADLYHFHDPELIPFGKKLIRKKKKVIYDVHEDVPRQILAKYYLPGFLRRLISWVFEKYEDKSASKFSAIIVATAFIRERFSRINNNCIDINNFPILGEFPQTEPWENKKNEICYVGGLSRVRGIAELVKSLEFVDTRLNLAGLFDEKDLEKEVKENPQWIKVNDYGFVDRGMIARILAESKIGLVTLHPIINYLDSLPIKMFEYMAAGIPVIASNFPFWEGIINENKCGICVNPLDSEEIGAAIEKLISNNELARQMGENGRKAIETKYNWECEFQKLLSSYKSILAR